MDLRILHHCEIGENMPSKYAITSRRCYYDVIASKGLSSLIALSYNICRCFLFLHIFLFLIIIRRFCFRLGTKLSEKIWTPTEPSNTRPSATKCISMIE